MLALFALAAVAVSSNGQDPVMDAYIGSSLSSHASASIVSRPTPTGPAVNLWPTAVAPGDEGHPALPAETLTCLTKNVSVADCIDQAIGDVSVPTITPYLIPGAKSAVIISPGGGYGMLAVDREGTDIALWANSIGVSAFVLKYRVPGRAWLPFGGAPLMDAQRAMGLVRQMAGECVLACKLYESRSLSVFMHPVTNSASS
jgi:hypothetical protein